MMLIGVLMICAVSAVLLARRPGLAGGPDEPVGSHLPPKPPMPSPPSAAVPRSGPSVTAAAPDKPSQPIPAELAVTPLAVTPALTPVTPATVSPARRIRNNGFSRFAPAPSRVRA
jgi:hypothetical protein